LDILNKSIALVLDPDFAEKIIPLSKTMPVWIISSPANDAICKEIHHKSADSQITRIFSRADETKNDLIARSIYLIDEHHGISSCSQPYESIIIYGASEAEIGSDVLDSIGACLMKNSDGLQLKLINQAS